MTNAPSVADWHPIRPPPHLQSIVMSPPIMTLQWFTIPPLNIPKMKSKILIILMTTKTEDNNSCSQSQRLFTQPPDILLDDLTLSSITTYDREEY